MNCLCLLSMFLFSCCAQEEQEMDFHNAPYPTTSDSLRILAIGNSFTEDAVAYLPALVDSSSLDRSRIRLCVVAEGGASFQTWIDKFWANSRVTPQMMIGNLPDLHNPTLQSLLQYPWDVIIIQQASQYSYVWATYSYLREYLAALQTSSSNKAVCFVFHLIWSHTLEEMPYVVQGNIACYRKASQCYNLNVVIPTGTAIQMARNTELNTPLYLTRDNWHLDYGIGRYIAACTWFETLLCPIFGVTVRGNSAKPIGEYSDDQIHLAQQCALDAILSPYDYTHQPSLSAQP